MCGFESSQADEVDDEPGGEIGGKACFKEDSENGGCKQRSGDRGVWICQDRSVSEGSSGCAAWVMGRGERSEQIVRKRVGQNRRQGRRHKSDGRDLVEEAEKEGSGCGEE